MPRYLIQSLYTGKFLVMGADGEPEWVTSLKEAGGGVVTDLELIPQLIEDNCDYDHNPIVIDLDRLGTINDYPIKEFAMQDLPPHFVQGDGIYLPSPPRF